MLFAFTPANPLSSEVLLQAAVPLDEWEQVRPDDSSPVTLELRTAFNQFVAEVLSDTQETNLTMADVQEVLSAAAGIAIGRAEASGPGRAQHALQEAYKNMHAVGPYTAPQGRIILSVQSRPDTDFEMDELTSITETMLLNVGLEWELIFGYGVVPSLTAEVRLTFLLAPRTVQ